MSKKLITIFALSLFAVTACKSGYNKRFTVDSDGADAPDCAQEPSNADLIDAGETVLNLIASLSCNDSDPDGVLMGQSLGYGNQIVSEDANYNFYTNLMDPFGDRKPSLISIDYEHDRVYTAELLEGANTKLKEHWDDGGIVMISWMPLNPWLNDASDPEGAPGSSSDLMYTDEVDLTELLDGGSARSAWLRKLDAMANALQYLADNDIPVLWQPLPAPNSTGDFWWGLEASHLGSDNDEDASLYTDLWLDMHEYFTNEKDLNNLLWVYSPAQSGDLPAHAPADWAYPGNEYVDVIGAIAQNNALSIFDYKDLSEMNKPLGMARLNQLPGEETGTDALPESFDTLVYADRLENSYENIAFWVTWHSYNYANDRRSTLALAEQLNFEELSRRSYVLDLQTVNNKNLR